MSSSSSSAARAPGRPPATSSVSIGPAQPPKSAVGWTGKPLDDATGHGRFATISTE